MPSRFVFSKLHRIFVLLCNSRPGEGGLRQATLDFSVLHTL
nr:MAG TPA: hypothetical protein [Crassvirales sp.]